MVPVNACRAVLLPRVQEGRRLKVHIVELLKKYGRRGTRPLDYPTAEMKIEQLIER